jgi:hypothetical protein
MYFDKHIINMIKNDDDSFFQLNFNTADIHLIDNKNMSIIHHSIKHKAFNCYMYFIDNVVNINESPIKHPTILETILFEIKDDKERQIYLYKALNKGYKTVSGFCCYHLFTKLTDDDIKIIDSYDIFDLIKLFTQTYNREKMFERVVQHFYHKLTEQQKYEIINKLSNYQSFELMIKHFPTFDIKKYKPNYKYQTDNKFLIYMWNNKCRSGKSKLIALIKHKNVSDKTYKWTNIIKSCNDFDFTDSKVIKHVFDLNYQIDFQDVCLFNHKQRIYDFFTDIIKFGFNMYDTFNGNDMILHALKKTKSYSIDPNILITYATHGSTWAKNSSLWIVYLLYDIDCNEHTLKSLELIIKLQHVSTDFTNVDLNTFVKMISHKNFNAKHKYDTKRRQLINSLSQKNIQPISFKNILKLVIHKNEMDNKEFINKCNKLITPIKNITI